MHRCASIESFSSYRIDKLLCSRRPPTQWGDDNTPPCFYGWCVKNRWTVTQQNADTTNTLMLSVSFLAGRAIPMESGPASGAGPPPSVVKWKFTKTRQRLNQYTSSKYHQYISRAPVWTQIAHFTQAARCLPLPDHTFHQGWPAWDQAKRGPGRGLWIATHWTLC